MEILLPSHSLRIFVLVKQGWSHTLELWFIELNCPDFWLPVLCSEAAKSIGSIFSKMSTATLHLPSPERPWEAAAVTLLLVSQLDEACVPNAKKTLGFCVPEFLRKSWFQTACRVGRPHVRPVPDECVLIFVSESMASISGEREIGKDSNWSLVLGMRWKPQRGSISVCLSNGSYHSLSGCIIAYQRQGCLVQPQSFHKHVLAVLSAGSKSGRHRFESWLCYLLILTLGKKCNFNL